MPTDEPMVTVPSFQAPLSWARWAAQNALADYEAAQTPWTIYGKGGRWWVTETRMGIRAEFYGPTAERDARDYCARKNAEHAQPKEPT